MREGQLYIIVRDAILNRGWRTGQAFTEWNTEHPTGGKTVVLIGRCPVSSFFCCISPRRVTIPQLLMGEIEINNYLEINRMLSRLTTILSDALPQQLHNNYPSEPVQLSLLRQLHNSTTIQHVISPSLTPRHR